MNDRPQVLGVPGKNSASRDSAGFWVGSMRTRRLPMAFFDINATVSGRSTWLPLPLPSFRIMRIKRW